MERCTLTMQQKLQPSTQKRQQNKRPDDIRNMHSAPQIPVYTLTMQHAHTLQPSRKPTHAPPDAITGRCAQGALELSCAINLDACASTCSPSRYHRPLCSGSVQAAISKQALLRPPKSPPSACPFYPCCRCVRPPNRHLQPAPCPKRAPPATGSRPAECHLQPCPKVMQVRPVPPSAIIVSTSKNHLILPSPIAL